MSGNFLRFVLAGGIAAGANWLSRFAFSLFLNLTGAVIAAFIIGMSVAYGLNRLFVFDKSGRALHVEATRFVIVNLVALVQVWAVTLGLADYAFPAFAWHWHPEALAHAVGVASPIVTSYFGHRYFTFAPRQT